MDLRVLVQLLPLAQLVSRFTSHAAVAARHSVNGVLERGRVPNLSGKVFVVTGGNSGLGGELIFSGCQLAAGSTGAHPAAGRRGRNNGWPTMLTL